MPDIVCNELYSANTFQYIKTKETLSYTVSADLEKLFYKNYPEGENGVYYNIYTSTQQINNTLSASYVLQIALIYCAIVLFVICFTILALQMLYDAGKYKYRFQVLRNIGVEEIHIRNLILKQLGVWFGIPVGLAILLSGVFFLYLLFSFSTQIDE